MIVTIVSLGCTPKPKPLPPGFHLHPDFQLELVASEPLVFDPVDMEFDEKGRTFVLEMPGYPLNDAQSRLIILKDTNNDGIYDQRQVFAENLNMASSFMHYKGGMLVAAPPDLLFIKDTNGDDVADVRHTPMQGFANENLQHNFNGLTYGIDNWIYAANGGNSGKPFFSGDSSHPLDLRGQDIRFRPEEKLLERIGESSGGFGLTFDTWGHLFETHNLEHVSNLVFEGRYIQDLPLTPSHTLKVVSDHEENGLSRIYPVGEQETRVNHPEQSGYFSGACGITFYGGGAFPPGFNDNLFVADVVLNLVHQDVLKPDKAAFKTSRLNDKKEEFLASSDRAFRPVNMTVGPDGALYILDMHRQVIEHPEWIPDEMEAEMDLHAGKDQGRIYRVRPKANWIYQPTQMPAGNWAEMVNMLESPNQWVRMTTQRLLLENSQNQAIPALEKLFETSQNPLARLHCLWTLHELKALKEEHLLKGLKDPAPGVRENALKIAETHHGATASWHQQILGMTEDSDARVRMQVVLTLAAMPEIGDTTHIPEIISKLAKLLNHPDTDAWTAMAVAGTVKKAPIFACQTLLQGPFNEWKLLVTKTMAQLIGSERNAYASKAILHSLHQSSTADEPAKAKILEALALGWETQKNGALPEEYLPLLQPLELLESTNSILLIRAAGRLRAACGLPASTKIGSLIEQAKTSISDQNLHAGERLAMLQLIELEPFDKRQSVIYSMLDNKEPLLLQKEALNQLWKSNHAGVGKELLGLWKNLGPEARKLAADILIYQSSNHDLLLSALENKTIIAGELNLDLERRRALLWSDDPVIKKRAEALFSDAGVALRKDALQNMQPALQLAGDAAKGKTIFTTLCSSCHQYAELGMEVGPNLTEINRKSKESLLHDILDPNAAADTRYLNYQVRAKDGNIYAGMIHQESDTQVTLRSIGGVEKTLQKKDIENMVSLGISLMPEGLEAGMSTQDMADLLAFLQGRR